MAGALLSPPISANELIFRPQKEESSKETSGGEDEHEAENNSIQPKDFFWDQFLTYLATAIALLTLLDITRQFLNEAGGPLCSVPSYLLGNNGDATARDQVAYVNTYCLQSLPWSEYYPVFILLQGILLVAPHYLWSALFGGQFDFFFELVRQLDRLRDSDTGEYRPRNFEIVKKLEKEFPKRKWNQFGIFPLYMIKLTLQLIVALGSLLLNPTLFPQQSFAFSFECPSNFTTTDVLPRGWLFQSSVQCVYPSFRVFSKIQIANYVLLILAVVIAGCGLFWCFKRHTNALGYKEIALFAFTSCLRPDDYVYEHFVKQPFSPRIKNDLDFLLTRLFRADSGHGQVFKDLQVYKELKRLVGMDHELLHAYHDAIKDENKKRSITKDVRDVHDRYRSKDIQDRFLKAGFTGQSPEKDVFDTVLGKRRLGNVKWEQVSSIRDYFFGFMRFGPTENRHAYDISFGTIGYSLILARAFQEVISVNFHPFYRNAKQVCRKDTFLTNYITITFQDDIFTQNTDNILMSDGAIDDTLKGNHPHGSVDKIQFIVVGPFTEDAKKTTVNLHIERLNTGEYFDTGGESTAMLTKSGESTAMLTVRPLKIAGKDVSHYFCKYEPPEELFELRKDVQQELRTIDAYTRVGDFEGIKITCGKSECIFEFVMYKFIGEYPSPPMPPRERQKRLSELEQQRPVECGRKVPPSNVKPPPLSGRVLPRSSVKSQPVSILPREPSNAGSIALVLPANMFPQLDAKDLEQFFAGNATIQLSARGQESPIKVILKGKESSGSLPKSVTSPPAVTSLSAHKSNHRLEELNASKRQNEQQLGFPAIKAAQAEALEEGLTEFSRQSSSHHHSFYNGAGPSTPSPTSGDNKYTIQGTSV